MVHPPSRTNQQWETKSTKYHWQYEIQSIGLDKSFPKKTTVFSTCIFFVNKKATSSMFFFRINPTQQQPTNRLWFLPSHPNLFAKNGRSIHGFIQHGPNSMVCVFRRKKTWRNFRSKAHNGEGARSWGIGNKPFQGKSILFDVPKMFCSEFFTTWAAKKESEIGVLNREFLRIPILEKRREKKTVQVRCKSDFLLFFGPFSKGKIF